MASFTVKQSFSHIHSMSKDGVSKDGERCHLCMLKLKAGIILKYIPKIYHMTTLKPEAFSNNSFISPLSKLQNQTLKSQVQN